MSKKKTLLESMADVSEIDEINDKITKVFNVPEPTELGNIPIFPEDVTSLSSEDVGNYLWAYDSVVAFVRFLLSKVEVKYDYADYVLDTYKKELYLGHRGECNNGDANAWVSIDKDVREAELELKKINCEKTLLQSRLDIFTKYSSSISREISRRKSELLPPGNSSYRQSEVENSQESRINRITGKELSVDKRKSKKQLTQG